MLITQQIFVNLLFKEKREFQLPLFFFSFMRMKKWLLPSAMLIMFSRQPAFSQAQCFSHRYIDTIFHTITVDSAYFGSAVPYLSNTPQNLYLDVYQPANDTVKNRPVIVYQFGGGFVIGWRSEPDIPQFCTYFAKLGYVVVSIDYRIGLNATDTNSTLRAFYRGVQDERSALRFLSQNAQHFGIDTTRIILTGTSAGCFCGFANTYMNQSDWPPCIHGTSSEPTDLGCMDCSGNTDLGLHIPRPFAMINMWGAILDTNMITVPKSIPLVSFQGTLDDLVPYTYGYPFMLPVFPEVYGGLPIHDRMADLGVLESWHPLVGYSHEPELLAPWLNDTIYNYSRKFLYPLLLPRTSAIAGDSVVCKGATVVYSVVNTPGSWYCWQISGNGTVISNTGGNSIAVIWNDTGAVSVSVTEMNDIDAQGNLESFQTHVVAHSQPAFTDVANQLQVTFTNTSAGVSNYLWQFGNGDTSTIANPVENYSSGGTYFIKLVTDNGVCADSTSTRITIDSCPVAHFTYQLNSMNAFFYGDTTNTTVYSWNYGDGTSANVNAAHVFHQYQQSGNYEVILSVENALGCKSSDTLMIQVENASVGAVTDNNVSVTCDLTNGCELKLNQPGQWALDVYDLLGRKLISQQIEGYYLLQTSNYPPGIYILKLYDGSQSIVRKFVRQ